MLHRAKLWITKLALSGLLALPLAIVPAAHAASTMNLADLSGICTGASLQVGTNSTNPCSGSAGSTASLNAIIKFALNLFSIIVGIIAVVMITVGGLKYIVSGGDSQRVSGAKDTILFAIVGLVVVALAQVIVHFVISSLSNTVGAAGTGG